MQHDEFIGQVQARARLDSRGAAEAATRATLTTLARRLGGGLPTNIAAQLPPELGRHLAEAESEQASFDVSEFYAGVAREEGPSVGEPQAAFHARAVLSVVRDAVTGDLFERARDQLSDDYRDLFDLSDIQPPT